MTRIEIKTMWKSSLDRKLIGMASHQAVDENLNATDDVEAAIKGLKRRGILHSGAQVAWIEEPGKPATMPGVR